MGAREADSWDAIRRELVALLRSHDHEIEDAVVARMRNSGFDVSFTPEALAGLRPAAIESVNSIAAALEEGESWTPVLPPAAIAQIQFLARQGASLETVLRVCMLIGGVFFEFFAENLDEGSQTQEALLFSVSWQGQNIDLLMSAFADAYTKEVERLNRSPSRHLAERVQRVLAGGSEDFADLDYRLDACHVGLIAGGKKAELVCRSLAEKLGCDLLVLPHTEHTVWAWFGSRREIKFAELKRAVGDNGGALALATGEPRCGIDGWRLTHQEAESAFVVTERSQLTRYSDVALLAAAFRDEATGKSLTDRYLKPLDQSRNGKGLRKTLRTYLDLDCNAASTAAALDVDRHTVQRRLKKIEKSLGEPLSSRRAELDVALRLDHLTATAASGHRAAT